MLADLYSSKHNKRKLGKPIEILIQCCCFLGSASLPETYMDCGFFFKCLLGGPVKLDLKPRIVQTTLKLKLVTVYFVLKGSQLTCKLKLFLLCRLASIGPGFNFSTQKPDNGKAQFISKWPYPNVTHERMGLLASLQIHIQGFF